jgi:hypothetical protein
VARLLKKNNDGVPRTPRAPNKKVARLENSLAKNYSRKLL